MRVRAMAQRGGRLLQNLRHTLIIRDPGTWTWANRVVGIQTRLL